ncbi:CHAP domain-containing protein [Nocardia sp. NPDC004260]
MLEAAERIADAIVYKAAPQISKTHHEFPHQIRNCLGRIQHEDERLATGLDRIGPAARATPAHTDLNTTAEHQTPDEIAAHVARTGWATDPITLRTHTTDGGTVIPPRTLSEATAGAPPPFDPWIFRSRAGLTELFRMNIESGVRLDRLESLAPINPHYNCHGYTFSRDGEAGWLGGGWVDWILKDNGFRRIDIGAAVPGDVVVYRNADSVVTHSGVVADVTSGDVYVDSKQGPLSVVRHRLHEVTDMYGSDVAVYHTQRPDGRFLTPVENSGEPSPPWPPAPSPHDS